MNLKQMTREQKEQLYYRKMTELQHRWGNKLTPNDFNLSDMSDDELDRMLGNNIGQLRFEKGYAVFTAIAAIGIVWLISWIF